MMEVTRGGAGEAGGKLSALGYFRVKHLPLISKDTQDLRVTNIS